MKHQGRLLFSGILFFSAMTCGAMLRGADPVLPEVDFSQKTGVLKPLNGTNIGPNLSYAGLIPMDSWFLRAKFSTVRLHDVPLDNPGMRVVDTHMIFGNFHADASDPRNYYFTATDDIIRKTQLCGSKIIYRLGPSIEHSAPRKYFAKAPEDFNQFAEICAGIVRHYNHKWADGFESNIQYWEIWNEPEIPQMWDKDFTTFCRLYTTVAKRLRREFPEIRIGGPALCSVNPPLIRQLAAACKKEQAPLDFFSWHCYTADPESMPAQVRQARKLLDQAGFPKTELHLNEWHYFPASFDKLYTLPPEQLQALLLGEHGMNGVDSAAFTALTLTRWQDVPLDMANYYASGLLLFGLVTPLGPTKPYFVFEAFGKLLEQAPNRVAARSRTKTVSLLAGKGEDGSAWLLVSRFKGKSGELEVALKGIESEGHATVWSITNTENLFERRQSYSQGKLKLASPQSSAVWLIRFGK